jgi:hypothetical protein
MLASSEPCADQKAQKIWPTGVVLPLDLALIHFGPFDFPFKGVLILGLLG